ncbi:MAG: serine/threonine-protein kinase RsbW [Nocardioidaceae bacterium]|nr:serine/threonine-protein kinase RsbW [Nocardioidaceae bacterium]
MEIKFTLQLPRDALSIPVVRRVLNSSMRTLGVADDCLTDIEIALTEACTNVLDHANIGDEYEVTAGLDDAGCVIEVIDTGRGFDAEHLGHVEADPSAEEGRGIQLIRALVDRVHFKSRQESGTIVRLEKELVYNDGSPMRRLAERSTETAALDLSEAEPALTERVEALEGVDTTSPAG